MRIAYLSLMSRSYLEGQGDLVSRFGSFAPG